MLSIGRNERTKLPHNSSQTSLWKKWSKHRANMHEINSKSKEYNEHDNAIIIKKYDMIYEGYRIWNLFYTNKG